MKMLKTSYILTVLLFFIISNQLIYSQTSRDKNYLSFSLESDKTTYQVAETLKLTVKLRNNGPAITISSYALDINYGSIAIGYRKTGKDFLGFIPIFNRDCIGDSPVLLPTNTETVEQYSIIYQPKLGQFVLNEPGEYEIRVTFFSGHSEKLHSNIVKVKVLEPSKEEEKALELLRDSMLAEFISSMDLFWTKDEKLENGMDKAITFLERHPKSFYAPLVKDTLKRIATSLDIQSRPSYDSRILTEKMKGYCKKVLVDKAFD